MRKARGGYKRVREGQGGSERVREDQRGSGRIGEGSAGQTKGEGETTRARHGAARRGGL